MTTQQNQIIKANEVSQSKSSALKTYINRTIETLKLNFNQSDSPEAPQKIIAALIAAIVALLLIVGCLAYTLNQQTSQIREFSVNTKITNDYHRQTILSDYFKTMGNLILAEHPQQKFIEKTSLVKAMTQATLQELDPGRKRYIMMFLHDANFLRSPSRKQPSLLFGANIAGASLQGLNLRFANLEGSNLENADLRNVDLRGANLEKANLTNSCYNSLTLFSKNFAPRAAGMREVAELKECGVVGVARSK